MLLGNVIKKANMYFLIFHGYTVTNVVSGCESKGWGVTGSVTVENL